MSSRRKGTGGKHKRKTDSRMLSANVFCLPHGMPLIISDAGCIAAEENMSP